MSIDFFQSHLCVSSLIWRERSIEEVAASMMRAALPHLELAASPLAPGHFEPGRENSRLFNYLAEAGVRVASLRLDGMEYREKLHALELAGRRGIPAAVLSAEMLGYPDLIDRMRVYGLTAARAGVHLMVENDFYTCCDNAAALRELEGAVGLNTLGFAFSPVYALADGRDPRDEMLALGRRLRAAYLWDAAVAMKVGSHAAGFNPGSLDEQAPGYGESRVDWLEYFQTLAEIDFRGLLILKWLDDAGRSLREIEAAIQRSVCFCADVAGRTALGRRNGAAP